MDNLEINSFIFINDKPYPSPNLIRKDYNELVWEFIPGLNLSSLGRVEQIDILNKISILQSDLFDSNDNEMIIHGDLHPDNIIVSNNTFYMVDWDLAYIGFIINDVYNLYTSPQLHLNYEERVNYIRMITKENIDVIQNNINNFVSNKIYELSLLEKNKDHSKNLINAYQGIY
ncbi:phosphotransferase family enzyme [Nicoletella semolina]|uniref:Phosphotransferase family enzyme n=1 Tax=Nicoletella semolina TaxID=271160 RepID=A0A4R2N828_9PAST|nr:phosphotransferase [Nicoletella semolina]MDH2924640.1 hypothetical protein [Nicoletella semolina]TCP17005.1 phosphotransferase family enzyme [Nicoletella semolina]